jgi:Cu(I)/Ag(I) efflux system membrane fusion protein/cobalt-zinc-cadmium efflux system membrane fusion protein
MSDKNTEDRRQLPPMSRGMQRFSMVMFFVMGAALTAFLVGDPLGMFGGEPSNQPPGGPAAEAAVEPAGAIYMCPMHPEVIESSPGSCPICKMDLVQVRRSGSGDEDHAGVIHIDPAQVQNIGVVSTQAVTEDIARTSRTLGILDYDADRISLVNTKYEGWIEKVHVNYVGQDVRRGQPLFEIYSPDLVTTQEEYLRASEYVDSVQGSGRAETVRQAEALLEAAGRRLRFWDISAEQVRELAASRKVNRRLTVHSPVDGTVSGIMQDSLEGMHVVSGMNLYKIADLSTVWVHADIYESDLPWIRAGLPAIVSFRNDPDQVYRGEILFLYPEVDRETRTLKVCVAVKNPERRMRPGMYADVEVEGPKVMGAVIIPRSAVLRSGERDLVYLDLGEGRFMPREVRIGVAGDRDRIEILEGVSAGDRVVVQAQFMLDSESRIQEAIGKFRTGSTND